MTFYLIRHGETDWNVQRKLQGQSDIPLNDLGRQQALALKDLLAPLEIKSVFASDLTRAVETARLGFKNLPHLVDQLEQRLHPGLREVNLGTYEGSQWTEMAGVFGEYFVEGWMSADPSHDHLKFPEGESKGELKSRFKKTLVEIFNLVPPQPVAIVTHGLAIRTFIHSICDDLQDTFRTPNCAVLPCRFDPKMQKFEYIGPKSITQVMRP